MTPSQHKRPRQKCIVCTVAVQRCACAKPVQGKGLGRVLCLGGLRDKEMPIRTRAQEMTALKSMFAHSGTGTLQHDHLNRLYYHLEQ
eukprot:1305089-Amphidinium_carterae.1